MTSPTGSFSLMTSRMPAIMPSSLESSMTRRLYMEPVISPLSTMPCAAERSSAFAARTSFLEESRASAMAARALSLTSVESEERTMEADFAALISVMRSGMILGLSRTCIEGFSQDSRPINDTRELTSAEADPRTSHHSFTYPLDHVHAPDSVIEILRQRVRSYYRLAAMVPDRPQWPHFALDGLLGCHRVAHLEILHLS